MSALVSTPPLDGHRGDHHPLSIQHAAADAWAMAAYAPQRLWDQDTLRLPRRLRSYRRRMRAFAERELRPLALQADLSPHEPRRDADLLATAGAAGLMTDMMPWPFGSRAPILFRHPLQLLTSLKMEELCAACGGLGLFLGAHALGMAPLMLAGEPGTLWRHVLPGFRRIGRGERFLMAFAITEPAAGSDVEDTEGAEGYRPRCLATPVPGGYRISGRKIFISGGDLATHVTLFAALEGEGMESWTCFMLDAQSEGFRFVRNELKMGQRASGAAELELQDVFVPASGVVGGLRRGWVLNRVVLNFSRIPVGAIALGIARGAMEAAIDFCGRTKLAGKALLNYQEVQLEIATMLAETTSMRSMIWHAAADMTPTQAMASMTKLRCGDAAVEVCNRAMDLLGNHAVLHANHVEKGYRDARLTQIYEGTNQINRLAVVEDIQHELVDRLST